MEVPLWSTVCGTMPFGKDVDLPVLPAFGSLELFEVKKGALTGQDLGSGKV